MSDVAPNKDGRHCQLSRHLFVSQSLELVRKATSDLLFTK